MWRSLKGSGYLGCCQRQRFARPFLRLWRIRVKARIFGSSAAVDEIIPGGNQWLSTDSCVGFRFLSEVPSSREATHPCLKGPGLKVGNQRSCCLTSMLDALRLGDCCLDTWASRPTHSVLVASSSSRGFALSLTRPFWYGCSVDGPCIHQLPSLIKKV